MAICPRCKKTIDHLVNWSLEWVRRSVWVENDDIEYSEAEDWQPVDAPDADQFLCPECGEVLFKDESEAVEFLRK